MERGQALAQEALGERLCGAGGGSSLAAQQLPQTWQEQQNFRAGPTPFAPLMAFWYELAQSVRRITLKRAGTSRSRQYSRK